jgi:hypothetical protein
MKRILGCLLLPVLAAAPPALGQTSTGNAPGAAGARVSTAMPMRTLVVPEGAGVTIGPRSQAAPRSTLAPAARPQQRFVVATPQGDPLTGPTAAAAAGLAAAAALAVVLGGGSGGSGSGSATGAATRTR